MKTKKIPIEQQPETIAKVLRYHWRHAIKYRKEVIASFVVGPISIVIDRYISPIFIALLLTAIQQNTATLQNSMWLIVGYAATQLVGFVIGYRVNLHTMWSVQIYGARDINQEAYDAIARQSLGFHNNRFAGSLVSQVNKTSAAFFAFWNMVIFEIMFAVVAIIATLISVGILAWPLAIILALTVGLFITASYFGTRFMRPRQVARSKANTKVSGQLSDSIANIATVKIESNEKIERQRLTSLLDDVLKRERHVRRGTMATTTITSSLIAISRVLALVVAVWAVQSHAINAGVVYLIITYTFNLFMELWNISNALRTMYQITGDSEELLSIINQQSDITDTTKTVLKAPHGEVRISDLTFAHEDNDPLFTNFDLTIPAGQKIGVVGVSGSGKTTLTRLLLRLSEPQSGTIAVDGQDISKVSLDSLHNAIAYVPQEPLLFHRSLAENIAYSKPKATIGSIEKAAKDAQAYHFISSLKEGFDTLVGERGVKLSGGQRQRVAIARAILKNAPILVLDEATSALDSESEALIQKALKKLMEGRTSIVIAHRLSTIAKLDRIIVMEDGAIIEDGSHEQLLAQNGKYAQLWAHQSGGFIEE